VGGKTTIDQIELLCPLQGEGILAMKSMQKSLPKRLRASDQVGGEDASPDCRRHSDCREQDHAAPQAESQQGRSPVRSGGISFHVVGLRAVLLFPAPIALGRACRA
jgi:hypothetical protein